MKKTLIPNGSYVTCVTYPDEIFIVISRDQYSYSLEMIRSKYESRIALGSDNCFVFPLWIQKGEWYIGSTWKLPFQVGEITKDVEKNGKTFFRVELLNGEKKRQIAVPLGGFKLWRQVEK